MRGRSPSGGASGHAMSVDSTVNPVEGAKGHSANDVSTTETDGESSVQVGSTGQAPQLESSYRLGQSHITEKTLDSYVE